MRLFNIILSHHRKVAWFHLLLALAMIPGIFKLEMDNSPEVFFPRDENVLKKYRQFCGEFQSGPSLRLILTGRGIWAPTNLAWLGQLEDKIAMLPGVTASIGLASLCRWQWLEFPPVTPRHFRSLILSEKRDFFSNWVSPAGDAVSILVVLNEMPWKDQIGLLEQVRRLIGPVPDGMQLNITGIPLIQQALDEALIRMAALLFPALVLITVVLLWFIFHSLAGMLIPIFFVMENQIILFGIMGYAGAHLNLVNIILAPLVFVVSLAGIVHVLIGFQEYQGLGRTPEEAVRETYRDKRKPLFWTGMTTLAGFGSMITADLPLLQSLGIWSAAGIASMLVLDFIFYPALLVSTPGKGSLPAKQSLKFRFWAQRFGKGLARWSMRRRRLIVSVSAVTFALLLPGVAFLRVDDNLAGFFSPAHPVRAGMEKVQQRGMGGYTAELILSLPEANPRGSADEADSFYHPAAQHKLFQVSQLLRGRKGVYGATSSGDLVETAIQSLVVSGQVTENVRWLMLGLLQTSPESRKLLRSLVSADGKKARISVLVPMANYRQLQPTFDLLVRAAQSRFPQADAWITGPLPTIMMAQKSLFRNLVLALSLTFLCVLAVFYLHLGSLRLTFLLLLPNVWPIVLVLGTMGWLKIAVDSASIMTAAIILGLAVDNTLHTANRYLPLARMKKDMANIETTIEKLAPAHILTAMILVSGFAACALSELIPVARLGVMSSLAIALALLGDLLMVPALLTYDRDGNEAAHDK